MLRFLADAPIVEHSATFMGAQAGKITNDKVSISLSFADGSLGVVHYLANGSKAFPKERLEVFCGSGVLQLDNFRKLKGFGWKGFKSMNLRRQDKGQKCQLVVTGKTVTVKSPGGLIDPITMEQMQSFTAPMKSRNPVLHYVFARMGLAEEQGYGLTKLKKTSLLENIRSPWQYRIELPSITLNGLQSLISWRRLVQGQRPGMS